MADPLTNIEDRKGQTDMGVLVARVFEGALAETGSWLKAYLCTAAFCRGMFQPNPPDGESPS